jgi:hypothetical protein
MEGKSAWRNKATYQNLHNYQNNNYSYKSSYKYTQGNTYQKWGSNQKTHFINVPIEDSTFIDTYKSLCQNIKSANLKDFYPDLLQKPGKVHMTICVLDLGEDETKIAQVHSILENLNTQIKEITKGQLKFNFEKFESMGAKETTRVIYAKMKEDENYQKLSHIIHLIIKALVDNQIIDRSSFKDIHINYDDKTDRYSIKLHMTLFNVLFLNKILKKKGEKEKRNIDSSEILDYTNNQIMTDAVIDRIHFSRMRENKQTEKYEMLYAYNLY